MPSLSTTLVHFQINPIKPFTMYTQANREWGPASDVNARIPGELFNGALKEFPVVRIGRGADGAKIGMPGAPLHIVSLGWCALQVFGNGATVMNTVFGAGPSLSMLPYAEHLVRQLGHLRTPPWGGVAHGTH